MVVWPSTASVFHLALFNFLQPDDRRASRGMRGAFVQKRQMNPGLQFVKEGDVKNILRHIAPMFFYQHPP